MSPKDKDKGPGVTDGISRDDVLVLVLIVVVAVWLGILNPGEILDGVGRWLIEHKLLVPSQDAVTPLFAGVGLGRAQLGVVVGILITVVALLALRRRAKQQAGGDGPNQ